LIVLFCLAVCAHSTAREDTPFFFIQLTDPQFGMQAKDAGFEQETANFEFAVATANRLKPAFVIVTGDLVNRPGDPGQAAEYLRIAGRLDRSIPIYNVPGNHDIGNVPTEESIRAYTARFGPDHYVFRANGFTGIVLNSTLIHSPERAPELFEAQEKWLSLELEKARAGGAWEIVIFQHHPWFLESADEPDRYENIPRTCRLRYLELFRRYGVRYLFSGHYHRNQISHYKGLELVTTGPIGMPLGGNGGSGMRIVVVRGERLEHHYYGMGEIPNRIVI
jgi:3',5'-cyclic AMP phosphodiesterase CpdA